MYSNPIIIYLVIQFRIDDYSFRLRLSTGYTKIIRYRSCLTNRNGLTNKNYEGFLNYRPMGKKSHGEYRNARLIYEYIIYGYANHEHIYLLEHTLIASRVSEFLFSRDENSHDWKLGRKQCTRCRTRRDRRRFTDQIMRDNRVDSWQSATAAELQRRWLLHASASSKD